MKVLVTGAKGQLGRSIEDLCPQNFIYTDIEELDITDLQAVRAIVAQEKIDAIVNCAGYTNVEAAEDIRTYAANYDKVIAQTREQLQQSDDRLNELEKQVHHLITLLKENNIATAKLMKLCQDAVDKADALSQNPLMDDFIEIQNKMSTLRNADEEIVKSEERNRMQVDDLNEEFLAQQKNQKEIFRMIDPLYRHLIERKSQ